MNNNADFFKSHHFRNDPTVVDEFPSTTASATKTTTISPSTTSADETGSGEDGGEVVIA